MASSQDNLNKGVRTNYRKPKSPEEKLILLEELRVHKTKMEELLSRLGPLIDTMTREEGIVPEESPKKGEDIQDLTIKGNELKRFNKIFSHGLGRIEENLATAIRLLCYTEDGFKKLTLGIVLWDIQLHQYIALAIHKECPDWKNRVSYDDVKRSTISAFEINVWCEVNPANMPGEKRKIEYLTDYIKTK